MKKTRILFTGDSITDVYRTDVVRAMEGWLPPSSAPRNPAATNF